MGKITGSVLSISWHLQQLCAVLLSYLSLTFKTLYRESATPRLHMNSNISKIFTYYKCEGSENQCKHWVTQWLWSPEANPFQQCHSLFNTHVEHYHTSAMFFLVGLSSQSSRWSCVLAFCLWFGTPKPLIFLLYLAHFLVNHSGKHKPSAGSGST